MRQATVGVDRKYVGPFRPVIGDVELLAIGSADQAVGTDHVVDHANDAGAIGRHIVDVFATLPFLRPAVNRIGEVDAASKINPQIVRLVERLPLVPIGDHRHAALGVDRDHAPAAAFARDQIASSIEGQAVGVARVVAKRGDRACNRPLVDSARMHVAEHDVAFRIGRRAFRELVTVADLDQLGARRDDLWAGLTAGCRERKENQHPSNKNPRQSCAAHGRVLPERLFAPAVGSARVIGFGATASTTLAAFTTPAAAPSPRPAAIVAAIRPILGARRGGTRKKHR